MTLSDFEDPTELARCARSDCNRYRVSKNVPLCAQHAREQEMSSAGYTEPDLEAKLVNVRTEDDDHPGMVKVYDKETGEPSWVPAEANDPRLAQPVQRAPQAPPRLYVGPDPDTAHPGDFPSEITAVPPAARAEGCWVAYHSDWSGFALFDDEVAALRHAVSNSMSIGRAEWGQELGGGRYPK